MKWYRCRFIYWGDWNKVRLSVYTGTRKPGRKNRHFLLTLGFTFTWSGGIGRHKKIGSPKWFMRYRKPECALYYTKGPEEWNKLISHETLVELVKRSCYKNDTQEQDIKTAVVESFWDNILKEYKAVSEND